MRTGNIWRQFDYVLLIATLILVVFGIIMIRSATNGAVDPDLVSRVPSQIQFAIIGTILLLLVTMLDYRLLGSIHQWLYLFMVGILAAVLVFGQEGDGGARSWLNVGVLIQPAEIAKLLIIITLGYHLASRYHKMDDIKTVIGSLIHVAVPIALIFVQPDLGTVIVFAVLWFTLVWAAGLRIKHIAMGLLIAVMGFPILWSNMAEYQRERITNFITPDTGEERFGSRYNIRQAAIAIGSGGLFGKGYGNGTQTQYRFLRVRHTDFIFCVIAEEFGLVGGSTVIFILGVVIWRILRAARLAADPLGSMICYGIAAIIFFQCVTAIGMNVGVLPVTGLTLPLVSSGGTSLMSILIGIGFVQSVVVRRKRFA
ncbi:MAG: rod shape-determining protein RodA [Anaerolineae bacterium]|jgi:rod shape determining protein RodA|nr:rod shape-determining protein RodA [Anaerolineae bacterium]